jgi:hypothetical protein
VCGQQAAELRTHLDEIEQAGGALFIVGSGTPEQGRAYRERHHLERATVLTDPSLRSYQLAGFKRGLGTLVAPRALWNYARSALAGSRQRRTQGDALQQGGVLVVRPGGEVAWRFVSRASGDHASPAQIVQAIRGAA